MPLKIANNYGLKLGASNPTDYKWGKLPKTILVPNGDWTPWLPLYEPQLFENGEDQHGCHIFGTQNAIEIMLKRIALKEYNFSERHVYIGTDSDQSGGDPFQSGEWIRKNGMVDQDVLPMTKTFAEFVQPKPLPETIVVKAKQFLKEYEIKQEYVWNDYDNPISLEEKRRRIKEALPLGPLGVSLYAWVKDSNGLYYRPQGQGDVHWCVLYKLDGFSDYVFDSYDQSIKPVRKDMNYAICIRYVINRKELQSQTWWDKIVAWFKKFYAIK